MSVLHAKEAPPGKMAVSSGVVADVPLAGNFITFSLCVSVARIDMPPLQPTALAFVSYGFVLVRVRVRVAAADFRKAHEATRTIEAHHGPAVKLVPRRSHKMEGRAAPCFSAFHSPQPGPTKITTPLLLLGIS